MDFDDNEEDCTIYIEELKSDDSNLKMNAVVKVQKIAEILGPARVRDELIPYLIENIEEQDNEDEFLIKLADQIMGLQKYIGGQEYTHLLISPLEILSSLEEHAVREKSVESLTKIAENQQEKFYSEHFLLMIKQLAGWDNYPSRISACQLIGACYHNFTEKEQEDLIQIFSELCKDDTPMVRRTAAEMLEKLQKKIDDKQIIIDQLIYAWKIFVKDQTDGVRVKAIESTLSLIEKLSKRDVAQHIVQPLLTIVKNKQQSWRMRYGIAEIVAPLIPYLEQQITRDQIVILYDELLKDTEQEVKSITILKLPILCEELTPNMLAQQILPLFNNLVQDNSQHVRTSLAEIICKVAQNFEKVSIGSGIIPIIETLLKDEVIEVRLMVLSNIYLLNEVIGEDSIQKHIIPLFNAISTEKQWRYRLAFCEMLPKFREQIGWKSFNTQFSQTIENFSLDHYAHIREQNFKNLQEIALSIGFSKIKPITEKIEKLTIESKNYIYRVSYLKGIQQLREVMTQQERNETFKSIFNALKDETVPNVTINLLKAYQSYENDIDNYIKQNFLEWTTNKVDDEDADIQYYSILITQDA